MCLFLTLKNFTSYSSVSIVEFEQENAQWDDIIILIITIVAVFILYYCYCYYYYYYYYCHYCYYFYQCYNNCFIVIYRN